MARQHNNKIWTAKFKSINLARSFAARGLKANWIVLGDDGQYWVVRPVDAARLERAGHEIIF